MISYPPSNLVRDRPRCGAGRPWELPRLVRRRCRRRPAAVGGEAAAIALNAWPHSLRRPQAGAAAPCGAAATTGRCDRRADPGGGVAPWAGADVLYHLCATARAWPTGPP